MCYCIWDTFLFLSFLCLFFNYIYFMYFSWLFLRAKKKNCSWNIKFHPISTSMFSQSIWFQSRLSIFIFLGRLQKKTDFVWYFWWIKKTYAKRAVCKVFDFLWCWSVFATRFFDICYLNNKGINGDNNIMCLPSYPNYYLYPNIEEFIQKNKDIEDWSRYEAAVNSNR